MDQFQTGWIAGIMDGEGCIRFNKRVGRKNSKSPTYDLIVLVGMGNEEAVRLLQRLVGFGCVKYRRKGPRSSDHWEWQLSCTDARIFLEFIEPHLVVKREEARVALSYFDLPETTNKLRGVPPEVTAAREEIHLRLKQLKPTSKFR